mgnify:FL=1|jgi:inner membrane protein
MDFQMLYWHWLVIGMLLIIGEIFVTSFTMFWFGLGGLVVALVLGLAPELSLTWQLLIWAVSSAVFTLLWFKLVRPRMKDRTTAGIARESAIGESGQVIKAPVEGHRGVVRFTTPLLGSDEWSFICEAPVVAGDRVFVKDISGNTLVVEYRE